MPYQQHERIFCVHQHVITLRDAEAAFDGRWTNDAFESERGVGVAPGILSLVDLTRDEGRIPILFEIHDATPIEDLDAYEGVIEASLAIPSGSLLLENEEESIPAITVAPGAWRVRVHYANGDTGRPDFSEGGEHVRLVFFPGDEAPVRVLRPRRVPEDIVRGYRGPSTEAELRRELASENLSQRYLAMAALVRLGHIDAALAVVPTEGARLTLASIAWLAGPASHAALTQLMADPDGEVRARAVRSTALLGDAALLPRLTALDGDTDPRVRDAVAFARAELDPDASPDGKPRLLLCTVSALGSAIGERARKKLGARPIWFTLGEHGDAITLFEAIPEPETSSKDVDAVMSRLTEINDEHGDEILAVIGDGDELEFGLHIAATLEQARALFIADGFEVIEPGGKDVPWPSVLGG